MPNLPKQFKQAEKQSVKKGWTWERRTRHFEVRDESGAFVVSISTTMYDGTLTKKILAKLRRAKCPGV